MIYVIRTQAYNITRHVVHTHIYERCMYVTAGVSNTTRAPYNTRVVRHACATQGARRRQCSRLSLRVC